MLRSARRGFVSAFALTAVAAMASGLMTAVAAGALPDGRGYELVSPPDKNGGDVLADSARTRAAVDGEAIAFASLGVFADAIGTSVATEYIAERSISAAPGSNGWKTHAINPTQEGVPFRALAANLEPKYDGEFSDDLNTGVFFSFGALDGTQSVKDVGNLYLRTDLRTPGAGVYQLLSPCLLCEATRTVLPPMPNLSALANLRRTPLAAMTPDGGHVVFETVHSLTSDSALAQDAQCDLFTIDAQSCRVHVYEWDHGTLRLAGILPDGRPADVSLAGDGVGASHVQNRTPHVVSNGADGHTRVFFTQPTDALGQTTSELSGFARIQTSRAFSGNLFARLDGTSTIQLNESERAVADTFSPAQFLDASVDGTRSFFMTKQALTNDAPTPNTKVYMYDATKPARAPDNLTLLNPDIGEGSEARGLIGTSNDGRYVYMIVEGQLVRGEPSIGNNPGVFLWHDREVSYIGYVSNDTSVSELLSTRSNYVLTPRQARITPDGTHLLFSTLSGEGLTRYDHGSCVSGLGPRPGCREMYLYSAETRQLRCVSCRPGGEPGTAMAQVMVRTNNSGAGTSWHETNALSDDGRYAFFSTAEALVPEDANGRSDAYRYDAAAGSAQLLSSGRSTADSWFMEASTDGRDAFFLTREPLVGWDADSAYDLYDARIGGGFPEPAIAPPGCSAGGECQGFAGVTPNAGNAATALFRGSGGLVERLRPRKRARARARACRRGFVKRRVRGKRKCVKRQRSQRAKQARPVQRSGS